MEYKFSIPAGRDYVIFAHGQYLASIEQNGPVSLEIDADFTRQIQTHISVDYGKPFSRLRFVNDGAQTVNMTVAVSDKPIADRRPDGEQEVAGAVDVNNFPAVQKVELTNPPENQTVSGEVIVTNIPAVQQVELTNPTANQTVSGSVDVDNFPAYGIGANTFMSRPSSQSVVELIAPTAGETTITNIVAGGTSDLLIYSGLAAPASYSTLTGAFISVPANDVINITKDIVLPDGWGLWIGAYGAGCYAAGFYK